MQKQLDIIDYAIFNELYLDPLQSYQKIGDKLGIAGSTIRDRILSLRHNGYLFRERKIKDPVLGERLESDAIAAYNPKTIGLIRQHIIFESIRSNDDLNKIIKFCNEHPYTHFRSEILGDGLGIYAQFDIPPDIKNEMYDIYEKIKNKLSLNKVRIINETNAIEGNAKFINSGYWMLPGENNRLNNVNNMWDNFEYKPFTLSEPKSYNLSSLDAQLLRELTINAKAKVTTLGEIYGKNKSTISRRINNLRESVIHRAILRFNREAFGLNYYQLVIGKFNSDLSLKNKFMSFLLHEELPVISRLTFDNQFYIFYTVGPARISNQLTRILWDVSDPTFFKVYQMNTSKFFTYYFYHLNYIGNNTWKTETPYIYNAINVINK